MKQGLWVAVTAAAMASWLGCAKKAASVKPSPPPPVPAVERGSQQPAPAPVQAATRQNSPAIQASKPRFPDAATRARIDQLLAKIEDAYFDYDKASLRPDALATLEVDSRELRIILADYPDYKLTIEGHCDERGSAEYNIALGDQRASAAKNYLVQVGIPTTQLSTVSYGKEQPVCSESSESCWQRNRRIHIIASADPRK